MASFLSRETILRARRVRAASADFLLSLPSNGCGERVSGSSITEFAFDIPSVSIGVTEGEEQYLFQRIHSVILTGDGAIVVGDHAPRIALFDRNGGWIADLAGRGSGPGELQMIGGLWAGPGDSIVVWDARQRKLAFIPRVPGDTREVRVPWGPGARPVDGIGGTAVFELETGQLMDTAQAVSRLVASSGQDSSNVVGPYPVPEIGWAVMPNGVGHMVNAPIFESYAAWDVSSAGVWWTDGVSSRLSLYSWTGERLTDIDLPVSGRPISGSDLEAYYAGMLVRWGADLRPENGEDPPTAATAPRITRIVADDRGLLWLGEFDPGADYSRNWAGSRYLVVSGRTREVLGHVAFPVGFTLTDVRGGLAAGVWEGPDGLHYAQVYEVRRVGEREDAAAEE